jgi:hypothetical protein
MSNLSLYYADLSIVTGEVASGKPSADLADFCFLRDRASDFYQPPTDDWSYWKSEEQDYEHYEIGRCSYRDRNQDYCKSRRACRNIWRQSNSWRYPTGRACRCCYR